MSASTGPSTTASLHDVEFLGAAVRSDAYEARAAEGEALLDASHLCRRRPPGRSMVLARLCLLHPHGAHHALQPAQAQQEAPVHFDVLVRRCFGSLTGIYASAGSWRQAARGFAQAGLGLRSCAAHAPATYLASAGSFSRVCRVGSRIQQTSTRLEWWRWQR